ncbi:MAG: sensor domain-containing diguanylate cyclase [Candidatus Omnitrophica bacterium]|nr:sensor domain-containing diguanylate cyclase [Candidatus Omnitrophota bacterium]
MIRKQKKPLSRLYFLVIFSFFVPLAGFFVYATRNPAAYFFLVVALLADIFLLAAFHGRLQKKQSQIAILKEEYFEKANLLKAELQHEWETIASLRLKIINYSQLKDLTEKLSLCLSLEDTSNTLSVEVSRLFGHKDVTVILYLFHSATGELGISSSQKGQMQVNLKAKKGDIFDHFVVKTMHPLLVEDVQTDFRFDLSKMDAEDNRQIRSLISTPLIVGEKTLGILRVDSALAHQFSTDDLRFLRTISDLTSIAIENAQLYEHLETMAIKDGLTGLFLRRYMMERLGEEVSREMRLGEELSFLMIDLDYFKQYNDSFGHMAGDIVLKTISQILEEHFNHPGELVCRYGGEEFCVLLPGCSKTKAVQMADEYRKKIEKREVILRRQKTHVTVSVGVASFPKDAPGGDELIFKADEALYRAKETGRNKVCAA